MKIIVIGLNWLGDIIMSLPAILAAAESHELHVITRPHLAEIYQLYANRLTIHPINTQDSPWQVIQALKPIRKLCADTTIVLPDSFRAAAIASLCGSKEIVGYKTQWRSFLMHRRLDKPLNFKEMHESDLHFLLFSSIGLVDTKAELPAAKFSAAATAALAAKTGLEIGKDYFILAPGAAFGSAKRWPPQRFAELAELMHEHYSLPLLITGSHNEKSLAAEIAGLTRAETVDLTGQTSLIELALLLSRARAMIANDSGTMHLGAISATPTVVPVGPTDMQRTGPLNKNCRMVIARNCPLAPCRQKTCPRHDHICMLGISATEVFAQLQHLEQKRHG